MFIIECGLCGNIIHQIRVKLKGMFKFGECQLIDIDLDMIRSLRARCNVRVYPRVTSLFEARVRHIEVARTIRRYTPHLGPTPWGDTSGGPAAGALGASTPQDRLVTAVRGRRASRA